jgi:hypothetical protein
MLKQYDGIHGKKARASLEFLGLILFSARWQVISAFSFETFLGAFSWGFSVF